MLKTHSYSNTLCLDMNAGMSEIAIHITRRMSCGKDYRTEIGLVCICHKITAENAFNLLSFKKQFCHLCLEMHLTTRFLNLLSHILYDDREFIGAYMRMCIGKDIGRGSKLAENIQNLLNIATLLASGIEFAVTIRTSSTFAETIVGFIIHLLLGFDTCKVFLTLTHILTSLYDNRTKTMLYKT